MRTGVALQGDAYDPAGLGFGASGKSVRRKVAGASGRRSPGGFLLNLFARTVRAGECVELGDLLQLGAPFRIRRRKSLSVSLSAAAIPRVHCVGADPLPASKAVQLAGDRASVSEPGLDLPKSGPIGKGPFKVCTGSGKVLVEPVGGPQACSPDSPQLVAEVLLTRRQFGAQRPFLRR